MTAARALFDPRVDASFACEIQLIGAVTWLEWLMPRLPPGLLDTRDTESLQRQIADAQTALKKAETARSRK